MLLSALSFLVVAQSSSEVPEGLMNNPVYARESSWNPISSALAKNSIYGNPMNRNPISHSMTAPPTVLSPSSTLPPPSSHCAFISVWQNSVWVSKTFHFLFSQNYLILKLRRSRSVCIRKCSVYLLGAWLPPNFTQKITVSEGYIYIYIYIPINR